MSKPASNLVSGTFGANKLLGYNTKIQKQKAFERAEDISKNGTKLEKKLLNTITIVYDEENNKYYYGMNHGIEIHGTKKNPILFGDSNSTGLLPNSSLNHFPLGNCSEVDAINNALNDGAKLENLHITTLDVKKKHIRSHNIIGKCACENCTYTFKGKVKNNNTGWKGK